MEATARRRDGSEVHVEFTVVPVTMAQSLEFNGFLEELTIVAPRGETQWVRNLRASGEGRLRKGRRVEEFTATEVPDEEKLPLLRAYLKKWAWEVGAFFQGVGADAPDEDLRRIAPLHPVFQISPGRQDRTSTSS